MQLYKTSCKIDLILRFSLRSPELMTIADTVGKYYRWFNASSKSLKYNVALEFLDEDLKKSTCIDAKKCHILLQNKVLHELTLWNKMIENEEDIYHGMVSLFCHLHHVIQNCANSNNNDQNFLDFANKHIYFTTMTMMSTYPFRYIQVLNLPWVKSLL